MNQISLKRSSETTRVTPQLLDFLHYIAGLIDGDGSIYLPTKGGVEIDITLPLEDLQTLNFLKKTLGFGLIRKRPGVNAHCIRISKKQWALLLLYSIKDKFCTPEKQKKVTKALSLLDPSLETFQLLSLREYTPPILSRVSKNTAWFAGFCDAEGSLTIQNRATLSLSISQKNRFILEECQKVFGGHIYRDNSYCFSGYVWSLTELSEIEDILEYFKRFPLKTLKRIRAFKFKRLVFFIKRGDHLSGPYHDRFKSYVEKFRDKRKKI